VAGMAPAAANQPHHSCDMEGHRPAGSWSSGEGRGPVPLVARTAPVLVSIPIAAPHESRNARVAAGHHRLYESPASDPAPPPLAPHATAHARCMTIGPESRATDTCQVGDAPGRSGGQGSRRRLRPTVPVFGQRAVFFVGLDVVMCGCGGTFFSLIMSPASAGS